ncbi:MAG: tripartite tricarboxylate transporter substrate binding protein [Bordetella sp.]|nr:tripartite tricarboxylate transporter substrate binding protein [Bordetella sp.]
MHSRRSALLAVGGALAGLGFPAAGATEFPKHPVKVVVPFPPGPTDTVARIATERLPQIWGQPVFIDNRGGAGGQIGGTLVARSPADGYTLLFGTIHFALAPSLYPKLPYDIEKDFVPISLAAEYPTIICLNDRLPIKNLAELVAYAKANPGKLSYGSSGNGGGTHVAGELFKMMAGVDLLHVPYKGSGPAMTDLIGGQVQLMFADAPTAMPQIQGRKIRPIAVGSARRSSLLPELPTVAESGYPGYAADSWTGVWAPAATPKDVVQTLSDGFRKVLAEPDIVRKLAQVGAEARPGTPQQFAAKLHDEIVKWAAVVKQAGIKPD